MPDVQEVFRMATEKVRPDPGAMERQNRTQRRRSVTRRAGGYALLGILVIAAAVIGVIATRPRDERPADQPKQDSGATAAERAAYPHFLDLETGRATLLPRSLSGGYSYVASPDGTRVAYGTNVGGGCGHGDVVKVANIDGTDVRTLLPPEGFINCAPRWSPDGTKLVYQQRADTDDSVGNLFVHDLATGENTQITDLELTRAWWYFLSPRFGAGGFSKDTGPTSVIFHLPRSSTENTVWDVWSVPATGGEPTILLRNAAFPIVNAYSAEGYVIQFVEPETNHLAGQRLMTGRPIPGADIRSTLVEANESIWWPTRTPDESAFESGRIAYQDGGSIYVVDLFTGESSKVAEGTTAEWLDNDTLIVAP